MTNKNLASFLQIQCFLKIDTQRNLQKLIPIFRLKKQLILIENESNIQVEVREKLQNDFKWVSIYDFIYSGNTII